MINRPRYLTALRRAIGRSPVVALLGPRQCGKTTLARQFLPPANPLYFDLEDPAVAQLMENPMTTLQGLHGLVIIDEAQRQPALFPVLRVLADRAEKPATFLILGSASPDLLRQASESLAGRVEIIEMPDPQQQVNAIIAGEITTNCYVEFPNVVRETIKEVGYTRAKYGFDYETCAVLSSIHGQSGDIAMGVDTGGAGDQIGRAHV